MILECQAEFIYSEHGTTSKLSFKPLRLRLVLDGLRLDWTGHHIEEGEKLIRFAENLNLKIVIWVGDIGDGKVNVIIAELLSKFLCYKGSQLLSVERMKWQKLLSSP